MARVYNTVLYTKGPLGPRMMEHICVSDAGDAILKGMLMLLDTELANCKVNGCPFTAMESLIIESGHAIQDKDKQEMHITIDMEGFFLSIDERMVQLPNNS